MPDHPFLTTAEVASTIGVSRQTVDAWIRAGRLPARRIQTGKRIIYRVRREDLLEFARKWVRDDW